ncbi:acyl-CoA-binding protein [soil metagenome]|jgi:diazepam-binding inhibitor (GABA receptor modulating acyl-CoA-binding protein)
MTDLKNAFEKAAADSKQLASRPDNETLLQLYSLYKQATEGDINTENAPAMFDFVAQAKYNAWQSLKGVTAEDAMQQYVNLVTKLSGKTV